MCNPKVKKTGLINYYLTTQQLETIHGRDFSTKDWRPDSLTKED
jgi:hypothetical protein